ncbi:Phage-tail_3 domain containing protein [Streptomyces sp. CBMAI 2042]|uniref:hypothetical protein n=1 Tax=Streptomyces sp. CBMAI 2042 TaxID=2305222 RepID=UPI000F126E78|nr:hypothetical protein [Streptomyces sp. CBMAI 2042]RLV66359.1 Phage-tail_3 domain containing protein [Streptomyces sp. CBMAI 2042]
MPVSGSAGVAARTLAYQRRHANTPGPSRPSGETSNGQPVTVEMYLAGTWVDITPYVLTRDGSGNIEITGGRSSAGSKVDPGRCRFQLNNRDGRFSPRNPVGPYFGTLSINTQVRVSVPGVDGLKDYRFWGELSDLPQEWDTSGSDIWVDVEAMGVLARLQRGRPPATSILRRGIEALAVVPLAYWPCEDLVGSAKVASAAPGLPGMTIRGPSSPALASYTGFGASDPLPVMTGTELVGRLPEYTITPAVQVRFLLRMAPNGAGDGQVICRIQQDDAGTMFWELYYTTATNTLTLRALDPDGSPLGGELAHPLDVRGTQLLVSIELQQVGTGISRALRLLEVNGTAAVSVTDTQNLSTLARVTLLSMCPATVSVVGPYGTRGLPGGTVGHVAMWTTTTPMTELGERLDPTGETAGARFQRLCAEARVAFESLGFQMTDTAAMGPEPREKAVDRLEECETADLGIMYEARSALALGYRPRTSLYTQDPTLTLSYTGGHLSQVPKPVDDLSAVKNVVDVTNASTSGTARASATVGPRSTAEPPEGIGEYGDPVTVNIASDTALPDQAGWRLHLGTVDEARYPQISVNLARAPFTSDPALRTQVLAVRPGNRIVLQGPLPVPPSDDISLMALGYAENIDNFQHRLTFNCQPESPWRVAAADHNTYGRADTDGSVLYADVAPGDTTITVAPSNGETGLWSTNGADLPWDIRVGGEVMTVTAASPAAVDTFTRTASNTWGTADSGQVWTEQAGLLSDRSVTGTAGVITLASAPDTIRRQLLVDGVRDCEVLVSISPGQVSLGQPLAPGIVLRHASANAFYRVRLLFRTDSTVRLSITNVATEIVQLTTGLTYTAGAVFWLRARVDGHRLRGRVWADGTPEPDPDVWQIDRTITSATVSSGSVGVSSSAIVGNSNVNPTVAFGDFALIEPQALTVTRSVNGVSKPHSAGADVRLANPPIVAL